MLYKVRLYLVVITELCEPSSKEEPKMKVARRGGSAVCSCAIAPLPKCWIRTEDKDELP